MNVLESKEKKDKITSSNNYSPTSILDPKINQSIDQNSMRSTSSLQSNNQSSLNISLPQKQNRKLYHNFYFGMMMFVSAAFLLTLFFNLYHFVSYISVSKKIKNNQPVDPFQLQMHLKWLTRVTMPFFREQFFEEYIYELGRNKKWQQLIKQADQALSLHNNKHKFSIYYHKSMGLCFLMRFKQCRKTIQEAYKFSSKQKLPFIQNIYNILLSNGQVTQNQIPTGQQFALASLIKQRPKPTSKKEQQKNLQQI